MGKLATLLLVGSLCHPLLTYGLQSPDMSQPHFVIAKLPPPVYPAMARTARVSGDVEVKISLQRNGIIGSVEATSGPAMLRQAAIDSVRQTQFACGQCSETAPPFKIVYRFQLAEPLSCLEQSDSSYPRITQSLDTITIIDRTTQTCDPAATIEKVRARSAKCLFLWECGWHRVDPAP
jgi:TonB family protein